MSLICCRFFNTGLHTRTRGRLPLRQLDFIVYYLTLIISISTFSARYATPTDIMTPDGAVIVQ